MGCGSSNATSSPFPRWPRPRATIRRSSASSSSLTSSSSAGSSSSLTSSSSSATSSSGAQYEKQNRASSSSHQRRGYAARALFWLENDRILLLRVEPNNAGLNMLWIFSNALKSSKSSSPRDQPSIPNKYWSRRIQTQNQASLPLPRIGRRTRLCVVEHARGSFRHRISFQEGAAIG
jgi:hypothetical protein